MKSSELFRALAKKRIFPLYYFHGPEKYLLDEAVERIKTQALGTSPLEFNFEALSAGETETDRLLFSLQALPLNSAKRLVVIRQADILTGKAAGPLIEYFRDPNPSTCVVFIGEKADLRLKFFQALGEKGAVVSFYPLEEKETLRWMQEEAERLGFRFPAEGREVLVESIGPSLQDLKMEIQKLALYLGERTTATLEDIAGLLGDSRSENPFDLSRAVGRGEWGKALRFLRKNLHQGEAPVLLLSLILRQFKLIFRARELRARGFHRGEIEKVLKILPRRREEFWIQVKEFPPFDPKRLWELTLSTDRALKWNRSDRGLLLENYLWELYLSSSQESGKPKKDDILSEDKRRDV